MAELTTEQRQQVWRGLMRYWSNLWESWSGDTPSSGEILTTVNETDTYIDENQVDYNMSLTYADDFTPVQKTLIFCVVAAMRVSPAFCRQLLGNLD